MSNQFISWRQCGLLFLIAACGADADFDVSEPGRGPGSLVGNGDPVSDGNFVGGDDVLPLARPVTPPLGDSLGDCDAACRNYCAAQPLDNPVHRGLCPVLWGVGLEPRAIDETEACRRLWIDMLGRAPTASESASACEGRQWNDVVKSLLASDEFVLVNQRRYADFFGYDTQTSNVETIYDMDGLVGKLARGLVAYDQFAAVASAHPQFMRRFATPEDIAEAVFVRFMGRPPFDYERADFARLYQVWRASYINHLPLGMRLPDAFVGYECVDAEGNPDPDLIGQCTSTLFGYNQVILTPDYRTAGVLGERELWSGLISPAEWTLLQTPGRAMATTPVFWEAAVDSVLQQYLGYDLPGYAPEVREELVSYLLRYNGDLRAVHYAVATSVAYLQSSAGDAPFTQRITAGPRNQMHAEDWLATVSHIAGAALPICDHRITRPDDFMDKTDAARALVDGSRWELDGDGDVVATYANVVRSLGGCPVSAAEARFRIVSILTTSTQLGLVAELCDPSNEGGDRRADVAGLLPAGVTAASVMTPDLAASIGDFQTRELLGRASTAAETTTYRDAGTACQTATCSAEEFARVSCFGILSSAELLFY